MQDALFYVFAALTLVCGGLVVANPFSRNPVTSAMFLVLTIMAMAGLFVLLEAFFLAAVQVLVYAGAVIVLFLFVVMVLDLQVEERQHFRRPALIGGGIASAAVAGLLLAALDAGVTEPAAGSGAAVEGSTRALGGLLFRHYLLPFEIVSVLLLAAVVGVVLLSKRNLK